MIEIPDAGTQILVTAVGPEPGGFIRIEGRPTHAVSMVTYFLSPNAVVVITDIEPADASWGAI